MIGRRGFILLALSLVLVLCSSCRNAEDINDADGGNNNDGSHVTRRHISQDSVAGIFLFSLDGQSIAGIDADSLQEAIEVLSDLDAETSENPAAVPDGGFSGGRDLMFFVVLESSATLTVGTDGSRAIYDSVPFESSYDACQRAGDLYSRLIETTPF